MRDHLNGWGIDHAVHQPLGVDTRVFAPQRADAPWRASLGLPSDARLLVFAGRFAARSGSPRWWKRRACSAAATG